MNTDFTHKPHRRRPLELQLTAMIDVFSMIVIFLIFGTVFGAADMVIPPGMRIPKSQSKEGIESAPRVSVESKVVRLSLVPDAFPTADFHDAAQREKIRARLAPLLEKYKPQKPGAVSALNLVADRDAPYGDIFDVVSLFRGLGFNTILFVATGGERKGP